MQIAGFAPSALAAKPLSMTNILVTGSSRGIGKAIAQRLRARGAIVIGHATRAVDADTIAADFAEPPAPQLLWQEAMNRLGGRTLRAPDQPIPDQLE